MSRRRPVLGPGSVLRLPSARIAVGVLAVIAILVAFGSVLAPQNPLAINANALFQGPSAHHLLGTDYLGRDVLSRLMAGTRLSVLTALEAVGIGLVLGAVPGLATVFVGRWFDFTVNRVSDALMTFPYIFFAVAVTAALGNGLPQAMIAVGILLAPAFFRVTRAATLEHARAQYVEAAELLGASKPHVIRTHVLRKVLPNMVVTTASLTAAALLAVSFLTFLGIGVQPPTPTWGGILSSDLDYLSQAPWAPFIPGALIAVTVGALNALADAFRDRAGAGTLVLADPRIPADLSASVPMAIDNRHPWPDLAPADAGTAGPADEVLRLDNLHVSVHHGAATAVRGVSLQVRAGEIVGLVGESGSGKTLTCRSVLGVLPAGCAIERGTVSFAGRDVTSLSRRDWERLHGSHLGAVFQDPASYLNPVLTVGSQLAEVLRVKLGLGRRAAHRRALELFEAVGLRQPERVYHQIPAELSGGMLQRVMIAIAVSCDPQLLVADEPTTALDVTIQAEVLELLRQLRAERGLAVLFVSHDLGVITHLCDRIAVFYAGEIVESGPADQIAQRPGHPYTQALLRVASVGDFRRRELEVIPGQPPRVGADITGCRFAARCPVAIPECGAGPVRSVPVGDQHGVRCVHADRAVVAS